MPDVEPFNPDRIKTIVKERIQSQFVDLVPDEMWEQMIEKEWKSFTTDSRQGSGYHTQVTKATLSQMINEQMKEVMLQKIKDTFAKPEWQQRYDEELHKYVGSDKVQEMIPKVTDQIVESVLSGALQAFTDQCRMAVTNQLQKAANGY